MLPGQEEQQRINDLAREFEAATGAQALAAVTGKADGYPEIPWKAFALGAAFAALCVVGDELLAPDWASIESPMIDVIIILGTGVFACLLTMWLPAAGRLLLSGERAGAQVRRYAEGLFLRREVFRTAERSGVLILVAGFERRATIQLDTGIGKHFTREDIVAIIDTMTPHVRTGALTDAFRAGFEGLARHLAVKGVKFKTHGNELPDGAIVEKGQ